MRTVRGTLYDHADGRRGQMLSGSSMGYDPRYCPANVETGGKDHTRYRPCGERLQHNHKTGEFVCPKHGPMH